MRASIDSTVSALVLTVSPPFGRRVAETREPESEKRAGFA
jgi:hypothetical protein